MKYINTIGKVVMILAFIFTCQFTFAQSSFSGPSLFMLSLLIASGVLLIGSMFIISENYVLMMTEEVDIKSDRENLLLMTNTNSNGGTGKISSVQVKKIHKLRKGHNIKLKGVAKKEVDDCEKVSRYAVRPFDFRSLSPIPRVVVNPGDDVKAGDVLFHDKKDDRIKYVAPVSGEVVEIRRGAKRAIRDIIILADKEIQYKQFESPDIESADRIEIAGFMQECGLWSLLNERPFDIVPDPSSEPANIFISCFDTAPLAPDTNMVLDGKEEYFQKGLDVLSKLTSGKVHLGLNADPSQNTHSAFSQAKNVEKHSFKGKHPAGNVGVQIHHIAPISSTKSVWTLNVQEVVTIGEMFIKGVYNAERIIAITGVELKDPRYIRTHIGASIGDILNNEIENENVRIVQGDVLSGIKTTEEDFLGIHTDQLTVLAEGDYYELFGWILAIKPRPTISKSFPNFLFPKYAFTADTNTHGERRAFVMTGQYESVLPMDIYPQHLMKAIMANDVEKMEGLGILEMTEEDIAICEFTCTSKIPLQAILREGLDAMREQI